MNRLLLAIDMRDPAAVAAFHAVWRHSDEEKAAIKAHGEADRRFANEVRTLGKIAAVSDRVQRVMKGATGHE